MTEPTPAHLRAAPDHLSRLCLPLIVTDFGDEVEVKEQITGTVNGEPRILFALGSKCASIDLVEAQQIADQLSWLVANHPRKDN